MERRVEELVHEIVSCRVHDDAVANALIGAVQRNVGTLRIVVRQGIFVTRIERVLRELKDLVQAMAAEKSTTNIRRFFVRSRRMRERVLEKIETWELTLAVASCQAMFVTSNASSNTMPDNWY